MKGKLNEIREDDGKKCFARVLFCIIFGRDGLLVSITKAVKYLNAHKMCVHHFRLFFFRGF